MSKNKDLVDIKTMFGNFKDVAELSHQFNLQSKALNNAYNRIRELEEENEKLRNAANGGIKEIVLSAPSNTFLVPAEERLCLTEIEKLEGISQERALTFEETKRLDILVKNLYLSREKNKVIDGSANKIKELSDDDLLLIAESKE